jgi:hypothetical protein
VLRCAFTLPHEVCLISGVVIGATVGLGVSAASGLFHQK